LKASCLGGLRVPKSLVLCEGPKSARDCGQISNANSDAPSEVHQLSVATCQSAAGRESIFGECRSRAAWAPIDKIRPVWRTYAFQRTLEWRADAPRQWNGLTARDADRGESNSSESGL